jgi:Zn-dependent protease
LVAALLIHLGVTLGWFHISTNPYGAHVAIALKQGLPHLLAVLLSIMFSLNLVLCCFNVLPIPPLDGSSFPLLFLSPEAAARYCAFLRHPGFALAGVILAYRFFPVIFEPVQAAVARILFP